MEDHLYEYKQLKNEIKLITDDILHASPRFDEIGGGKSNTISDPTAKKATALGQHRRLLHLEIWIDAIETVYESVPEERQRMLDLRYWKGRSAAEDWVYIANDLNVSERTVYRWRNEICKAIGHIVGER